MPVVEGIVVSVLGQIARSYDLWKRSGLKAVAEFVLDQFILRHLRWLGWRKEPVHEGILEAIFVHAG